MFYTWFISASHSDQKSQFLQRVAEIYLDSPLLLLRLSSSLHPAMVKYKTVDTPDNLKYDAARSQP